MKLNVGDSIKTKDGRNFKCIDYTNTHYILEDSNGNHAKLKKDEKSTVQDGYYDEYKRFPLYYDEETKKWYTDIPEDKKEEISMSTVAYRKLGTKNDFMQLFKYCYKRHFVDYKTEEDKQFESLSKLKEEVDKFWKEYSAKLQEKFKNNKLLPHETVRKIVEGDYELITNLNGDYSQAVLKHAYNDPAFNGRVGDSDKEIKDSTSFTPPTEEEIKRVLIHLCKTGKAEETVERVCDYCDVNVEGFDPDYCESIGIKVYRG